MKLHLLSLSAFLILLVSCQEPEQKNDVSQPPSWAKEVVWYQIFVERFNNGDPSNDPTPETVYASSNFHQTPEDWSVTPWTHSWYEQEDWAKNMAVPFYDGLQLRRFGGDLQGVMDKLDYLEDLGITAIYFNPINDAPSLHKYDARNYRHIDVNFGPDPEGDLAIIAAEIPDDPSTWKWTTADKMFLELVEKLHQRNIRVILDYSWNHTGVEFWAWKDIVENQQKSRYKDWYAIKTFDDPSTPENEFEYEGWLNLHSLPEIKKVDVTTERIIGYPYEGDIYEGAKKHIFNVTERWLAPNGDVSKGIDGYRLDVADHVGMKFWRDWREHVKAINPEAYLVGEIWWAEWPDKLMNPVPYVKGDVFDAVMFYQVYRPARYFFAKTNVSITAEQLVDSLQFQWSRLQKPVRYAMMNTAATHDSPRLLTSFNNPNKYKVDANPRADSSYNTGKPDPETFTRTRLYLLHQFTSIGAPHIWNGDEMGMWGADDPDCRKPLHWTEYDFEQESRTNFQPGEKTFDTPKFNPDHYAYYQSLIELRKNNPVLSTGEIEFIKAEGKLLGYTRQNDQEEIIVLFNLSEEPVEFQLPEGKSYNALLDKKGTFSGTVAVEALGAFVGKLL
jgi:glycosidase